MVNPKYSKMFTLSYSNDYHDSAWKKRKKYILHYKTWQWYSYKNHTIKLQCLRHEMHLFYIHYLQLQREITKLSIGFPILVSLTIPHNTHQWFQWDTLIHVNMHMIWNTHTRVFLMCTNLKHTHDAHIWNAVRVNMYSGCWCWNRNSFDLLYRWPNITCTYSNSTQKWKQKHLQVLDMSKNSQIS